MRQQQCYIDIRCCIQKHKWTTAPIDNLKMIDSLDRVRVNSLELVDGGGVDVLAGSLRALAEHLGGLRATDTTTPLAALLLVLVRATTDVRTQASDKVIGETYKLALAALTRVASSRWSSLRTSWRVTTAAVFLWTTVPRRALPLTMT